MALTFVLVPALAACGATTRAGARVTASATAQAAATSTTAAQAQATVTAQPVTLAGQLAQRGTVAAHDVQLIATATIAKHTNATIHLAGFICWIDGAHTSGCVYHIRGLTIGVQLYDIPKHWFWESWGMCSTRCALPSLCA